MKSVLYRIVVGVMAAFSLAILGGCEGGDDSKADLARPADISGTWVGQKTGKSATYPVEMTLTQEGSSVHGTYVQGRSSFMNPQPDTRLDVSGTYDSSTGIFNCNGWWIITFLDDNTMYWPDGGGSEYTTTLHRQ